MVDAIATDSATKENGGFNLDYIQLYNKKGKLLSDKDIESLKCLHCLKLLRNPYQLIEPCGDRFCKSCLDNDILTKNPKVCPVDGELIEDRFVKPDKGCLRELKSLTAVCQGKDDGCTFTGTIEEAEFHVQDCVYITVPCPNGCGKSLSRSDLTGHMEVCPKKPNTSQILQQLLDRVILLENGNNKLHADNTKLHLMVTNLQSKVNEYQTEISNLNLQVQEIPHLQNKITDLNNEVSRLKGATVMPDSGHRSGVGVDDGGRRNNDPGYGGSDTFNRAAYTGSGSQYTTSSSSFSSGASSGVFSTGSYPSSNYSSSSGAYSSPPNSFGSGGDEEFRSLVKKLQNEVSMMRPCVDEFNRMQSQLVGYMETVQTVQESVTRHAVAMEEIKLRQDILDVKTTHGIFIWKIPEISRRYGDAQQRRTLSLYSPPFHTSPHGYRMCIRAYLNGDGSGKGTHISVFFVLMKSEHDNLLSWPFKSPVTFQLLNVENSASSITETFMPDVSSPSFQQPKSEMNIASGFPRFAKQTILKDSTFTKNDAIFIRCKVDLTNIDPKE